MNELHLNILPRSTAKALEQLQGAHWLEEQGWYLAGGTALALQAGHRRSVDLDFFSPDKNFAVNDVLRYLPEHDWKSTIAKDGTIYGVLLGAKVSFIAYPFFQPAEPYIPFGNVHILHQKDIAVMKVIAISQRGRKRDFVDLYWYVKNQESLANIIRRVPEQYSSTTHDFYHFLKSLMYFQDADNDPMPSLNFTADWKDIKKFFEKQVPLIAKELVDLL